ncbi:phosphoribosylaminoimidazolesuccinocarboxamide synthase [Flammeovirga kamogawensis]|uniref:Phosphoribosylaminoimidazole-succinocarboxamide synthase n=1 Tax=Flammeovirga kamogawensis TaxID=373891 RepID=A0ABX8GUZ1_9BACT|nr:phosphoribosylaminoimidazolesuccinocarboxamide synthase [Flammeovirga kamogawensis]MBB6459590.1 phosphoribosylaminoimidazole-succinocarboxamide synthase [Flammeovirga kamogawensis]QWG07346.1 phosphoribosylaminoimidazolesuccinocarboxamide synthase [Flammeovirga kamogawensis]TRX69163.1 phosphoribosylaminoimidazolesuccinocarboxamide synthase [Flammeovirga kamogawensis]
MDAIKSTKLEFENATGVYHGKVRDVYFFDKKIAIVATDRISAFDVVLKRAIPYKGQVLNQIAEKFLKMTADIVPNWLESTPHSNVHIGKNCEAFAVEMVIRGYLAGHAWREYREGKRILCGVALPGGLKENDKLPEPIITPTTKAMEGHDEDISREEILAQGVVSEEDYVQLENYTRALFNKGTEFAKERGLILVDTKYEFGKVDGKIYLIDEVHTPDSSRYFYAEGYQERQDKDEPQKQLSKEFVRQWLIENDFQGKDGQEQPIMSDEFVNSVSDRYIELYENITGEIFEKSSYVNQEDEIFKAINTQLG